MKSIKTQYIDLMEGRMSQHNFMRSLRMTLPQYITNVTSFKDSVRILKNKGILSEAMDAKDEDEEFIDMITKAEEEEAGKYTKFDDFEGGLSEAEGIKIDGKVVTDYKQNGDKSYSVEFEDGSKQTIAVSNDNWDIINSAAKEKLNEGKGKELHPNQIHPQELRMGIKVELEHTDDLDKAKKIALDHLAENPFYYTALKLSGIESPSVPKYKAPVAFKKEVAAETELVDKINAMKPVKGFEKAKASSNKAKKETNSGVKGVSELTHNAKSVRGLQKFAATGGKMKTVKEGRLNEGGEHTITGTLTKDEQDKLKDIIGNYELDVEANDDTLETTISHPTYNDRSLEHALKQVRGMLPQRKQFGYTAGFGNTLQSKLEALVREVLDEMYDGRDDMNEEESLDPKEQELVDAVLGDINEGIDINKVIQKVRFLSNKGLLTLAMASTILASCGTAGGSNDMLKREIENAKKVKDLEMVQQNKIDSVSQSMNTGVYK